MGFFSFSKKIGIDLGTANTLVFVPEKGIVLNEPSVVAVSPIDNKVLAVGAEAKQMIGRTPDEIVAYRPLKDGVIADYRITEAMLSYFILKTLGKTNLFKPDVVVSVPAGVTSTERRAVIEAALRAGARSAYTVKEPILAALGAGVPIQAPRGNMIVDIGGGTADVAVISLGGIVASLSVKCAGDRIDRSIIDYVRTTFNLSIGEETAEEIKIKIGSAVALDDELSLTVSGRDALTGLPRSIELTTNAVVKAIQKDLREIIAGLRLVLQETPPELVSDIMETGVIMTGGSSLLRHFPELIFRRTGVKAVLANDTILCVAQGAGVTLDHLDTYKHALMNK